jgi:lysozyme family protein
MFSEALPFILKEEGGYVNDPKDSGGATNKGITQKTYDAFRKSNGHEERSVRHLTKAEMSKIYSGIWTSCKASELPVGLDILHFDFAVNAGNRQAAKILQRAVYVEEDGIIGPMTLGKIKSSNIEDLIHEYSELRKEFYRGLVANRPKDLKFLKGWLLRTDRVTTLALSKIKKERSA